MSDRSATDVLREVFGFADFRPGQEDVVETIAGGRAVLCVMPTGAGKSLCYQVPALMRSGLTIVISPLVALMDDQVAGLRASGVDAVAIHSGKLRDENVAEWRKVQTGDAPILYLSPERLMTERMLSALAKLNTRLIVVDEAHCISKWGASFRPEYEALSQLPDRFPQATVAAFTATADTATQNDIAAKLFRGNGDIVVHGFDRPNLMLAVAPKRNWKRQMADFVASRQGEPGIVYCLSRKMTEEAAGLLVEEGHRALPYHAGMDAQDRKRNQDIFMTEPGVVMVATIAFGMGIDKPDIRYVFHVSLPGSMEAYYQEIGRAGRDGGASDVYMLYGFDDIRMRRQFIHDDGADEEHKRRELKRLDALLAYCEAARCRRQTLLSYFGEETGPCGNCDTCLDPPELRDGTREAQLLCETVIETGDRFGAAHVIDVLRGGETQRILELNHDRLNCHGTGEDKPRDFWQSFVRQAVAGGLLTIDIERYGALRMTRAGRALLAGERSFEYREPPKSQAAAKRSERKTRAARQAVDLDDSSVDLLGRLKALRLELAQERGVPAYVIFPDAALLDMVHMKPQSLDDMAMVNGVGPKKLKDFGNVFLEAIK